MSDTCTLERFLSDVENHTLEVIRDEGVHRHLKFSTDDRMTYAFDLITWPGHLCISGDCGTYVFARIPDMFEFFRDGSDSLGINPHYWGEKLRSQDKIGGFAEFNEEGFIERVTEAVDEFIEENQLDADDEQALRSDVEDRIISEVYDCEGAASCIAVRDFEPVDGKDVFPGFFDGGAPQRFTFHYIWCLYAIVWGIRQYDQKEGAE